MKHNHILLCLALLGLTGSLSAQITITNAIFPVAGDSLKIANDLNPNGITVTAAGGPYNWDYTSLNPTTRGVEVFHPASEGTHFATFPNAELVANGEFGAETYFDVSATAFSVLGASGDDVTGGGLPFATDLIFTPPLVQIHAPLSFPNVFSGTSSFNFAIAVSDLPGGILDSLGIPSGLFDSIRIKLTIERNDFVDAYGTVAIPGGSYDALRIKRTDNTNTRLEIHVPIFGWQDVTDLLGAGGFGVDTTITYNFLSNTAKEPIAVLTMDSTGTIVETVDYKDNGLPSAIAPVLQNQPQVIASPNPVSDNATFTLQNVQPGKYTLRLLDVNGRVLITKEINTVKELVSLETLYSGIYIYQLLDSQNHVLATGKVVKE